MALSDSNSGEVHLEDRELVEKLAKLQKMHDQIQELRTLLPERLLRPTRAVLENPARTAPAKLAVELKAVATQGNQELRRFQSDFRSEEMQALWQQTSSVDVPQGHDAWMVDYKSLAKPSSAQIPAVDGTQAPSASSAGAADSGANVASTAQDTPIKEEDVEGVLKSFQEAHPKIRIEVSSGATKFPLSITLNALNFEVNLVENDGKKVYSVNPKSNPNPATSLSTDVSKAIKNSSPQQTSLEVLLSMLESYRDLKFRPCDKCKNIFDDKTVAYPLVRKQKPPVASTAANKDDSKKIEWEAFHSTCL